MAEHESKSSKVLGYTVTIISILIGRAIGQQYPSAMLTILLFAAAGWFGVWLAKKNIKHEPAKSQEVKKQDTTPASEHSGTEHTTPTIVTGGAKKEIIAAGFRKHYNMEFMSDQAYDSLDEHKLELLYNEGLKIHKDRPKVVDAPAVASSSAEDDLLEAKMAIIRIGFKRINNISPSDEDLKMLPDRALKHYYEIGLKQFTKK